MNVLHLSSESSWRGGEQQIAYLIDELLDKEVEIIVAGRPDSAFEKYCRKNKITFFPIAMKNSTDIKSGIQLNKLCLRLKIDILHAHSSRSHAIAWLAYLLGNKTPLVVSRRVDFTLKNNLLSRHKYNIPTLKKIACVSDAIKKIVQPNLRHPENCVTIHSGINLEKFEGFRDSNYLRKTYSIDNNITIIGNTSAIAPHKDYFTFVDTAKCLIENFNKKVHFFIIGTGPLEAEIKAYISKNKMNDFITMTGFLDNIHEVLPSLDIFFISSETEGLGTSIIDAFASKVPVVATSAGGIPELVKHEKTGLLAPVGDVELLACLINKLISDTSLKDTLINNALELSQQFSKKVMGESYYQLYNEISTLE